MVAGRHLLSSVCLAAGSLLCTFPLWQRRAESTTWPKHRAPVLLLNEPVYALHPAAVLALPRVPRLPRPPRSSRRASSIASVGANVSSSSPLHLVLPRHEPCIELADVRAAHALCASSAPTLPPSLRPLTCPRSLEKLCVQRAAKLEPRCESSADEESRPSAGVGHPAASRVVVSWRDVVIGIAVHESMAERRLLQAAADTWLRNAAGADLVLVTDIDDARNASAIAPLIAGEEVRVHVYRCAECRGAVCPAGAAMGDGAERADACAGVREGWLARRKILHLFAAMHRRFGPPVPSSSFASGTDPASDGKQLFLKVDPDTVPVPHNLLRLLVELDQTLGRTQPFYFGMAACRVASFPLCHAAGGAGYGISRAALSVLNGYVTSEYPRMLSRIDKFTYGGEDVTVAFALKKAGGVSVLNTGCLYQHKPRKYAKLHAKAVEWVKWPLSTTPASFHKFKDDVEMRAFFACALYARSGRPRPAPRALFFEANGSAIPDERSAPCEDGWVPPPATSPLANAVVQDGGIVRIHANA